MKAIHDFYKRKGTQPDGTSLVQARNGFTVVRELNANLVPYADNPEQYVRKGYSFNDLVYMVVKRIVDKAVIAPWGVYKVVDDSAYTAAKMLRKKIGDPQDYVKYKHLMAKALEPVENDTALTNLITYPNDLYTLAQHHAMLWTYKLIMGEYFEYWQGPTGGSNRGRPNSLDYLPAEHIDIYTNKAFPTRIVRYSTNASAGFRKDFAPEEIIHEAYVNIEWDFQGSHLHGMSPVKPLLPRVQRNNESQTLSATQMKNGGKKGVMYMDIPNEVLKEDYDGKFVDAQTQQLKKRFDETLGTRDSVGKTFFSGYKVGYQTIGESPAELQLNETELTDLRMICANFAVPSQLFNDPANKVYANEAEGGKALILSGCLPLLTDREASINRQLRNYDSYKDGKTVISYDLSQYSELEVNRKDQADYLNTAWWFSPNEKRTIMGEAISEDKNMNKYYIPSNFVLLDDLSAPDPASINTDINALNNEQVNDYGS